MRRKEIERRLTAQGLAHMPEINIAEIERTAFLDAQVPSMHKKRRFKFSYAIATLLVLAFISVASFSAVFLFTPETELYFEINPSFKLTLNSLNKVEAFEALNADAENIFDLNKIENNSIDEAGDYILNTLYSLGYITDDTEIRIEAQCKNNKKAEKMMNKMKGKAENFMKGKKLNGKVNGKVNSRGNNGSGGNGNGGNGNNENGSGNGSGNGNNPN